VLGVKSTFLVEPDSDGAAVLLRLGVPPAYVSFAGDSAVLFNGFREDRKMDFRP
jgi:hypothetical protein